MLRLAGEPDLPWSTTTGRADRYRALAFIARAQRLRAHRARETFAVCDGRGVVGIAALTRDSTRRDRAEIGYWISRAHRGHGYATAAVQRLVSHGFERMALTVIVGRCATANRASAVVLDKVGFHFVDFDPRDPTSAEAEVRRFELTRAGWRAEGPTSAGSPPPP